MEDIYLDHAATTPVRAEVREVMDRVLDAEWGNPSSSHRWGREASAALEAARARVAQVIGARPAEICFTRGGTESDNQAILGRSRWVAAQEDRTPTVVLSAVEHSAVHEAGGRATIEGGRCEVLGVDEQGSLDLDALDRQLPTRPAVVSVMWVNNETGTILPVADVATHAREAGVSVHSDAVQALGKVRVDVGDTPLDLLTLTGHKIYGPKGVGILYVREGTPLAPLMIGGGQEHGLRPGTEDVAGAVGLAEAVVRVVEELEAESTRLERLRELLETLLMDGVPDLRIHGGRSRAPHVTNVGIPGVDQAALLASLDLEGVAASSGSACHTGAVQASRVLTAMHGESANVASLRFSTGHLVDEAAVREGAARTIATVGRLRRHASASSA